MVEELRDVGPWDPLLAIRVHDASCKTLRTAALQDADPCLPPEISRQDISATDGDTVRPPAGPTLLEGEAPAGLWKALAAQVAAAGFTLTRAEIPSGANGTTDFATRTVTVAAHLAPAQAAKTLAHELAHAVCHTGMEYAMGCRGRAEVEAESVAFIVCQAAGLVTAAYSFGYVAGWSGGNPKIVKDSAERVVTAARDILDRIGLLGTGDDRQEAEAA